MDWHIAQEFGKGARKKIPVTSKAICFSLNLLEINSQGIWMAAKKRKKKKSLTFIGLSQILQDIIPISRQSKHLANL